MINKTLPHIVLIVLDTHRYDRLSTYGYQRRTSPNIDDFAKQATIFENGISPAQWTIPAHASIFTGEYPSTHQTLHPNAMLDGRFDTVAKLLSMNGYQTTGFCNNPLLGILNNGLKRGFNTFYNYCGAIPSVPRSSNRLPIPLNRIWEWYTQQLRKASYPLQNAFAHSDFLFRLSLNPKLVPLWTKFANFKGDTVQSLKDVREYLGHIQLDSRAKPTFTFVNLMETHLPFSPPDTFIDKFAPDFRESREDRDFMRTYNSETFRWLLPVTEEYFKDMKWTLFSDMYDVEVAYQDHLLADLLEFLSSDKVASNTLTIIVGDHGEGLGEHNFMGHSFVAYEELVHVPLIIKFREGAGSGQRVTQTISTRRLFHTILDAANIQFFETAHRPATDVKQLSLKQTLWNNDLEQELVFVEAYPPNNFLSMMKVRTPHLVNTFHCNIKRTAVYQGRQKLARIDGVKNELFDLGVDSLEEKDLAIQQPDQVAKLSSKLEVFTARTIARRPDSWRVTQGLTFEDDENLMRQLRALGYIE